MVLLVIGGDSLLGNALGKHFRVRGFDVILTTRRSSTVAGNRIFLDLARADETEITDLKPTVTLLCAAVSEFKTCDEAPNLAEKVNVAGTLSIARRAHAHGSKVILFSTNAVFDGQTCPPREWSRYSPSTQYGRTKALVEQGVLDLGERASVLRLTKVMSANVPIVALWYESLLKGLPITPYSDFRFSPITLDRVTEAVDCVLSRDVSGAFHVSGKGVTTYAEFAAMLADYLGFAPDLVRPVVSRAMETVLPFNPIYPNLGMETTMRRLRMEPQPIAEVVRLVARELQLCNRN